MLNIVKKNIFKRLIHEKVPEFIKNIQNYLVWRNNPCDEILECSTLLTDQQSLTNIGLDMLMVMKVTLLVTELFFIPVVMDQLPEGGRSMEMFKPARCGVLDIFSELFEKY